MIKPGERQRRVLLGSLGSQWFELERVKTKEAICSLLVSV